MMRFARGSAAKTGQAEIIRAAKQIDRAVWAGLAANRALDSRYYELAEETLGGQFGFRYAVLKAGGQTAVVPFFLAEVDVISGLPVRAKALVSGLTRWWPRLTRFKVLVVGCAAGEGALAPLQPWAVGLLDETLGAYARREKAKLVVFKDFPSCHRRTLEPLLARGYSRIPSMPSTRLDLGFSSFEEYLESKMSAGVRNNLRRKLRDSKKLADVPMEAVGDVSGCLDEIYNLYLQTHLRSTYRFERLTPGYFSGLGRRMPDRARFFLWRREGKLVAFASGLVHEGVLYYLNLGMDYGEALRLHLYFCVWRDLVTWALQQNLAAIQAGQLNYEPKFRLGLSLVPLDLYVRPLSALLGGAFGLALPLLGPVRYDPALRKFPNFGDLR